MKKSTLNPKKIYTLLSAGVIVTLLLIIHSCNKDIAECVSCKKDFKPNSSIVINKKQVSAFNDNNSENPETILVSKSDDANIGSTIQNMITSIGLNNVNTDYPIALSLFYQDTVNLENYDGLLGVLFYSKVNDIYEANFWKKESDNSFTHKQNLSGVSTFVSKQDMYMINQIMGFNSNQLLLLVDQSKIAKQQYANIFQIKLDIEYNSAAPNGAGYTRYCNSVPECESYVEPGYCTIFESQEGLISASCFPDCSNSASVGILVDNGYTIDQTKIDKLYKIRNSFLMNSNKGRQYISDYYYASKFLQNNISLSTALKLYNLYNLDFFTRLSEFDNTSYNDSIMINTEVKTILLDLCNSATNITNDSRFNSIVNNITNDVDLYYNKTLAEIKNDFE